MQSLRHSPTIICRTAVQAFAWALASVGTLAAQGTPDASPPPSRQTIAATVSFRHDVLPILSRRCFACHGPDESHRAGKLRLDIREGALRTEAPVILPRRPEASELLRRVTSHDADVRMPPDGGTRTRLSDDEIGVLRRWIAEGANWGRHWAFEPPVRPRAPSDLPGERASDNPIDGFVRAALRPRRLAPAPPAEPSTLFRRLALDLVGLPPSADALDETLVDLDAPDSIDRQIDRWLASPRFGERWGRHWLDLARYSDSSGFETDAPRHSWKYRDWVLQSVNRDLPFDAFVVAQLAGDLLPDATESQRVATGFLLCGPQDGGSEPARLDAVVERLNTFGATFLGLTIACAQCHSHKFDAVSQREYYGLFAFLNDADESLLEFASPDQLARRDALRAQLAALEREQREFVAQLPPDAAARHPANQERLRSIDEFKAKIPHFDGAAVLRAPATFRPTHRFERGEFTQPREVVPPDVPTILPPLPAGDGAPRTRLDLARWLVAPQQPLVGRVTVNRFWQTLFGRGLVETENDFGVQGEPPSHPELLDWLDLEFREQGWSVKSIVRRIVGSATYRQSSARRADDDRLDPDNRWLARQARWRLDAEAVRDGALAVSGLLTNRLGGPSVFPYQPDGVLVNRATPANWNVSPGGDRYRRTLYTHHWRLTPHPLLATFDAPDSLTACTRRRATHSPLQSLALLHGPEFLACADSLATIAADLPPESRVRRLFLRTHGRAPTADEAAVLLDLAARHSRDSSTAGWTQVARTLLNLDEFLTRE